MGAVAAAAVVCVEGILMKKKQNAILRIICGCRWLESLWGDYATYSISIIKIQTKNQAITYLPSTLSKTLTLVWVVSMSASSELIKTFHGYCQPSVIRSFQTEERTRTLGFVCMYVCI